jgi:hypothetical protein
MPVGDRVPAAHRAARYLLSVIVLLALVTAILLAWADLPHRVLTALRQVVAWSRSWI